MTATERKRRQRERQQLEAAGWVRVEFLAWPELIDALETAGFAPGGWIGSKEAASKAVEEMARTWERNLDRMDPR